MATCRKVARQWRNRPLLAEKSAPPGRLIHILEQYGLLISIISNLTPEDFFALAATSKATYRAMVSGNTSIANLLGHMPCSGKGVALRRSLHQRSSASTSSNCVHLDVCASCNPTKAVDTNPCARCSHATCDECRIHCVFNSTIEPAEDEDELPTYSGFALLDSADMGILTPAHLNCSGSAPTSPYHDRGFLDAPWTSQQHAAPEELSEVMDFPIGDRPLRLADNSTARHPSCVIKAFWEYSEGKSMVHHLVKARQVDDWTERKLRLCEPCWETRRSRDMCRCTIRRRVLGRWLCLECFYQESQAIKDVTREQMHTGSTDGICYIRCHCGDIFDESACRIECLWCRGEVREGV